MIVLDTHVLLWAIADSKKLSRAADAAIRRSRQADGVAISAITLWELASLVARGRIRDYGTVENSVNRLIEGVTIKPITPEIAALATQFPNDYPHDPADRSDWRHRAGGRSGTGHARREHPQVSAAENHLVGRCISRRSPLSMRSLPWRSRLILPASTHHGSLHLNLQQFWTDRS